MNLKKVAVNRSHNLASPIGIELSASHVFWSIDCDVTGKASVREGPAKVSF